MYVNYVREANAFEDYAALCGLTANERCLWRVIFTEVNRRAQGADWPDEHISVSNQRVMERMPKMKEETMFAARKGLTDRKLIEYIPGKRNKSNPLYKINFQELHRFDPQGNFTPISGANTGGNSGANTGGNSGANTGGIYINYKQEPNPAPLNDFEPNGSDGRTDGQSRAGERDPWFDSLDAMQGKMAAAFREFFGRDCPPAFSRTIANYAVANGFCDEMARVALECSALHLANDPLSYTISVMRDWKSEYIQTPDELYEYQAQRDYASGKLTGVSHPEEWGLLAGKREKRKAAHVTAKQEEET